MCGAIRRKKDETKFLNSDPGNSFEAREHGYNINM